MASNLISELVLYWLVRFRARVGALLTSTKCIGRKRLVQAGAMCFNCTFAGGHFDGHQDLSGWQYGFMFRARRILDGT